MPDLDTKIHLNMLEGAKKRGETENLPYGMHWGDPNEKPFLAFVRDNYCANFVKPTSTVIEVGPGGGRWTRYLLGCEKLYAVDFHQELLDELQRFFPVPHLVPINNSGSDFPSVPDNSVDFIFSFGVFVHLDVHIVEGYLKEMVRVLKPGGQAAIQYPDKSKKQAALNDGFANNTPSKMRKMVMDAGLLIVSENLTVLPHAAIIHFEKPENQSLIKFQTYTSA